MLRAPSSSLLLDLAMMQPRVLLCMHRLLGQAACSLAHASLPTVQEHTTVQLAIKLRTQGTFLKLPLQPTRACTQPSRHMHFRA